MLLAAKSNNVTAIKLLLAKYHLNPNSTDKNGLSPLHIAVLTKDPFLASVLLVNALVFEITQIGKWC